MCIHTCMCLCTCRHVLSHLGAYVCVHALSCVNEIEVCECGLEKCVGCVVWCGVV